MSGIDPDFRIHPPVLHGDLLRIDAGPDDVVVLIDGGYHHAASVRHKEILSVIDAGAVVVGCSSMGALRAAELATFGMIGNGAVFEAFRSGRVEADDEVALAHGEPPDYRRFSEPLINMRIAVEAARRIGAVSETEAAAIVDRARSMHYSMRSWKRLEVEFADAGHLSAAVRRVRSFLDTHPEHADVKAADAVDTLTRLDEIVAGATDRPTAWTGSPEWRNRFLYEWTADAAGGDVDGVWVPHGAVIRYRQVYDVDFPRRWRRFVMREILSTEGLDTVTLTDRDIERRALDVAGTRGLRAATLTPEQTGEWLLGDAEASLPAAERIARVLIRSYRPPRGIHDLLTGEPDLAVDPYARGCVAESSVVNATVATWGAGQGVDNLKESTLRAHLAATWRVADRFDALTARARDRGLSSLSAAVEAVRPFFLRHHLQLASTAGAAADGAEPS
ncbi:TfuA-like protein [Virgisporangium aliadipatigenens]|uniref:TfuA-like protein n=1 Tax=Virgisporangium aliadipatigenens TaxID=741659 RepID=UPI001940E799|nr:TfuA-like protein [Virgisporangium aliadipatigenens]